jgi:hypothetical protein
MIGGDCVAAENFYQHAEHYFRINNASREGNEQGTPRRPTTPSDVEMNPSEAESSEVQVDRSQPLWDGDASVSLETHSLNQTRAAQAHPISVTPPSKTRDLDPGLILFPEPSRRLKVAGVVTKEPRCDILLTCQKRRPSIALSPK